MGFNKTTRKATKMSKYISILLFLSLMACERDSWEIITYADKSDTIPYHRMDMANEEDCQKMRQEWIEKGGSAICIPPTKGRSHL